MSNTSVGTSSSQQVSRTINDGEIAFLTERLRSLFAQFGHPHSVVLSEIEEMGAVLFKRLAELKGTLKTPISDFEYVEWFLYFYPTTSTLNHDGQIASSSLQDLDKIFHRMTIMESFRETYNVQDTWEEGMSVLKHLTTDHPGIILSVLPPGFVGGYITVLDLSAVDPSKLQTPEQHRLFIVGIYYILQCQNCEFRSIREGQTYVVECSGVTNSSSSSSSSSHQSKNLDEEFFLRVLHELDSWFPRKQKLLMILNATFAVNHCCALWIRHMIPNQRETTVLGYQLPCFSTQGEKINCICKPSFVSEEVSQATSLLGLGTLLAHRYQCVQNFRLPPTPTREEQLEMARTFLNQHQPTPAAV